MSARLKHFFLNYYTIGVLYLLVTVFAFLQLYNAHSTGVFVIYRASWFHFIRQLPLYIEYPSEYWDYFFYHPIFPVFIAPFALLPPYSGFALWLAVNTAVCFIAFKALPLGGQKVQIFMMLILVDLFNNLADGQSNPLLLAFMLLSWLLLERKRFFWAALFIALSFFVKGYGAVLGLLIFYHRQWWRTLLYGLLWFVALQLPALLFVSPQAYLKDYREWLVVIASDTIKEKFSLYGILELVHWHVQEVYVLLVALATLSLFIVTQYSHKSRVTAHAVAFLLVWVVVFNRAAEAPTYIIAIAGAILWYLSRPYTLASSILFWVTILIASIFPTDVFKAFDQFRYQYLVKTFLCFAILIDMLQFAIGKAWRQRNLPTAHE
jgi:Glycosyltransferase family 87